MEDIRRAAHAWYQRDKEAAIRANVEFRPLVTTMKSTASTTTFAAGTCGRIREGSRELHTPTGRKEVKTEGPNQTTRRALPWPAEAMSAGLMRELGRVLQEGIEARLAIFISPQNWLRLRHGHRWSMRRADTSEDADQFRTIQSLLPLDKDDVLQNNLSRLAAAMHEQAETLTQQNVDLLLEKVDEAVKLTGNEVSIDETRPFAEWYLDMLQRYHSPDTKPPELAFRALLSENGARRVELARA